MPGPDDNPRLLFHYNRFKHHRFEIIITHVITAKITSLDTPRIAQRKRPDNLRIVWSVDDCFIIITSNNHVMSSIKFAMIGVIYNFRGKYPAIFSKNAVLTL